MFGKPRPGAAAYAQLSVDARALAASPHQLVAMLYEGALLAVATARAQLDAGDVEGKGKSSARAIDVVGSGLAASVDLANGGEIAHNLAALYRYVIRLLSDANLHNDGAKLDEAARLLGQLKEAWQAIARQAHGAHGVET